MKYIKALLISFVFSIIGVNSVYAQMFDSDERWEDDERTIVIGKWSQLFYEINVGFNVNKNTSYIKYQADFLYLGFGVGKPVTTENAWRKFLPAQQIPDSEDEAELYGTMNTNSVWGGKVGLGWIHYFNHAIGIYTQLSWAFLGDFGSGDDGTSSNLSSDNKSTFIYNTAPIEAGLCINCWKHLHVQCGATYMWKEIPLLTIGVGATF